MEQNEYGMKKKKDLVECFYNGAVIQIPANIFFSAMTKTQYDNRKFVRYKEGAKMYGMSEREFYRLSHDAGAVYKRNTMALVKLDVLDEYMEYLREES